MAFAADCVVTVYGEAYGGKCQGMSATYGKDLKFCAFEVKIGHSWLDVLKAEVFCKNLNIEFVHYVKISTDLKLIDAERDADSVQAIRNGIGPGKIREGVVLRPLIELIKNNGERIICKHKRDEFRETKSPRVVQDPQKQKILEQADQIVDEYVVLQRLLHVLDKIPDYSIEKTGEVIKLMINDIEIEAKGEIVMNNDARKAISKKTALMYKNYLKNKFANENT